MLRLLGRLRATESISAMERLIDDPAPLTYYENGAPVQTTVGEMARDAIRLTNQPKEKTSE